MGGKFVDITFSIMKSDKFVIKAQLDTMIMNLGKGASVSLSEESDLFTLHVQSGENSGEFYTLKQRML